MKPDNYTEVDGGGGHQRLNNDTISEGEKL